MKEVKKQPLVVTGPLLCEVHNSYELAAVRETREMLAKGEAVAVQWQVDPESASILFADQVDPMASYVFEPIFEVPDWISDMAVTYQENRTRRNKERGERRRAKGRLSGLNQVFQHTLEAQMDQLVENLNPGLRARRVLVQD